MKIAVLYIATGRYIDFWKDFYISSEKYFINDAEKKYFVFTDSEDVSFEKNKNVKKIFQKKLGWPYDTLMRFDIFLNIEDDLKEFDYIFFFNANMLFAKQIESAEIIPSDDINDGLVVGLHPHFLGKKPDEFAYDRNEKSTAYIPFGEGKFYGQGCLFGGNRDKFLELCRTCSNNIKSDLKNDIIALWHDESHLNKYLLNKNPLLLGKVYLCPEGANFFYRILKAKIIQRDKSKFKYGGHAYLRGETDKKITFLGFWLNKLFKLNLK